MSKIGTIQDRNGDVWTGKVKEGISGSDLLLGLMTCGISELGKGNSVTVKVNGVEHTGRLISSK